MATRNRLILLIRKYTFNKYVSAILFALLTSIAVIRALHQIYIINVAKEFFRYSHWWQIPFNLFLWWQWFLFLPLIYWVTVSLSHKSRTVYYWALIYIVLPVCIIVIRQAIASIVMVLGLREDEFVDLLFRRTIYNRWIWLDFVAYFSIVITVRIVEYQKINALNRLKYTQLHSRLVQSQLNALKSQLRPHFLFNTLNSVSTSIVLQENEEAKRMSTLIKSFLKTTLDENEQQEIQFEQELRFINQYLEIEGVRFGDKLKVQQNIALETLQAMVPSFILLPLVENSMYHAVAQSRYGGIIQVSSRKENQMMIIEVEDNGPDDNELVPRKKSQEGVGIKITKERLYYLFGDQQALMFENSALGGLKVIIRIPFREVSYEAENMSYSLTSMDL
jgi:sensor histidine kinase YesM